MFFCPMGENKIIIIIILRLSLLFLNCERNIYYSVQYFERYCWSSSWGCYKLCYFQVSYDPGSCERNFCNCVSSVKNSGFQQGLIWTRDQATPVRRSNQLRYEATELGKRLFVGSGEPVRNEWWNEICHILNCGCEIK